MAYMLRIHIIYIVGCILVSLSVRPASDGAMDVGAMDADADACPTDGAFALDGAREGAIAPATLHASTYAPGLSCASEGATDGDHKAWPPEPSPPQAKPEPESSPPTASNCLAKFRFTEGAPANVLALEDGAMIRAILSCVSKASFRLGGTALGEHAAGIPT